MINIDVRSVGYGNDTEILRELSFDVDKGSIVLITGPSGSGKTTLALSMLGVIPNLIEGWVDGKVDIDGLNPLSEEGFLNIPRKVGIVLQDPDKQIAMPRAYDEVLFTFENIMGVSDSEVVYRVLDWVGMGNKYFEYVENLSGGEKRRLTLASAIVHDPAILILDEPTASMDPWGIKIIRDFLKRIRGDKTVILIEHKARYFLDLVDSVYVLYNGYLYELNRFDGDISSLVDIDPILKPRFERSGRKLGERLLKVDNLAIGYDRPLSTGINFELHRGEISCIIGRNGSGKSTLLKTIAGYIRPLDGSINREGRTFYIPQEPDLTFMFKTVYEEVVESAKRVGTSPEAYMEDIGRIGIPIKQSPFKLSHGQRRWLANYIGRIYSSDILLIDEPTTGLDLKMYRMVVSQIIGLAERGISILIATHDPRIIMDISDRVYILDEYFRETDRTHAIEYLEEWRDD